MFCTYVLHKWHGQFFGAHLRIFFLNSVGDTTFFNFVDKMSHIFGPKLDISFWAILESFTLQRRAISKTIIAFFLGKYFCQYFRRYIIFYFKYTRLFKLWWCIVTDLSFSKSSEKRDEKSLYTKLSALLCNPLMQLFVEAKWILQEQTLKNAKKCYVTKTVKNLQMGVFKRGEFNDSVDFWWFCLFCDPIGFRMYILFSSN